MSYLVSCLLVSSWHMSLVVVVAAGSGGSCCARGRCGRCRRRGNDRYSQVSVVPEERRSAEFGSHCLCAVASSGAGDAGFFTNTESCSLLLLRATAVKKNCPKMHNVNCLTPIICFPLYLLQCSE